jgi:predicted esterase
MISKNWSRRSVLACGILSLLAQAFLPVCGHAQAGAPSGPAAKTPAIALIDAADAPQWQAWTKDLGWRVITPAASEAAIDLRVQALATAVQNAIRDSAVDPARIYLGGRGEAAAAVFYTISRVPDLWAAGLALGGSPEPAIDSDRIFAANFTNVPVLWVSGGANDQALAGKLQAAKLNVEWLSPAGATNAAVFAWLAKHRRDEFPAEIDCETNSPNFAHCYWIQLTKFDVNERNDVLPSTRLPAASKASLDLGGFGYKTDDPGPGVLVSFLPEKYSGPLKMGDRIVALDGKPIENARQYVETMAKITDEKPAVATVQRGKERVRMETRIVLPRREMVVSARVEAQYVPDDKDIQIVSRTVKELRVTIPPHWAQGGRLYWNGLSLEKIDSPGCFLLSVEKELLHAAPCAN